MVVFHAAAIPYGMAEHREGIEYDHISFGEFGSSPAGIDDLLV